MKTVALVFCLWSVLQDCPTVRSLKRTKVGPVIIGITGLEVFFNVFNNFVVN